MSDRLKNVGLRPETHQRLKLLCAEQGWTMTEAVEALIEVMNEQGRTVDHAADRGGQAKRGKPGQVD
jgi:predicted DNA-binding protein